MVPRRSGAGMLTFISALFFWLACRFLAAELELEVFALRHQQAILRRQRPADYE
jgi:hypothetical protein